MKNEVKSGQGLFDMNDALILASLRWGKVKNGTRVDLELLISVITYFEWVYRIGIERNEIVSSYIRLQKAGLITINKEMITINKLLVRLYSKAERMKGNALISICEHVLELLNLVTIDESKRVDDCDFITEALFKEAARLFDSRFWNDFYKGENRLKKIEYGSGKNKVVVYKDGQMIFGIGTGIKTMNKNEIKSVKYSDLLARFTDEKDSVVVLYNKDLEKLISKITRLNPEIPVEECKWWQNIILWR